MLSISCKFEIRFLIGKKGKKITVSLGKYASHTLKQKSSAHWFSPSVWPLFWRHGFCQLSFSLYFSLQPMDDHISFVRTVYRLYDKGLSSEMSDENLYELSV